MAGKGTPAAIEVEGAPQLRKAFRKMGGRAADLSKIHGDIAKDVADKADQLAPRDRGGLAGSIKGKRTTRSATVTAGGRGVPYAGPIHFGWHKRNIEPQPFLYDALDDRRGDIVNRYREGIGGLVKQFDREAPD